MGLEASLAALPCSSRPGASSWFLVHCAAVDHPPAGHLHPPGGSRGLYVSKGPLESGSTLAAYNLGLVVLSGYMFYEVRLVGDPAV